MYDYFFHFMVQLTFVFLISVKKKKKKSCIFCVAVKEIQCKNNNITFHKIYYIAFLVYLMILAYPYKRAGNTAQQYLSMHRNIK